MHLSLPRIALIIATLLSFILFIASHYIDGPLILINPPITRRQQSYRPLATHIQQPPHSSSSCSINLNLGQWTNFLTYNSLTRTGCSNSNYATCDFVASRRWQFSQQALDCGAHFRSPSDALTFFQNHQDTTTNSSTTTITTPWIAFVGDSVARYMYISFLDLLGGQPLNIDKAHEDFERTIPLGHHPSFSSSSMELRATFHWKAYPENITELISANDWSINGNNSNNDINKNNSKKPDWIVLSASLWHMLHIQSAERYTQDIGQLVKAMQHFYDIKDSNTPSSSPPSSSSSPGIVIMTNCPETYPNKMTTAAKKTAMTPSDVDKYNAALEKSILSSEDMITLLDIHAVTYLCGEECSVDGIHSCFDVYDTVIQITLAMIEYYLYR